MNIQFQNIPTPSGDTFGIKRRDFMKSSAMLVSGMALAPWAMGYSKADETDSAWPKTAYNYITPLFLLQSTSRLVRGSAFVHAGIKHCVTTDVRSIVPGNSFLMGGLVPFSGVALLPSLEKLKTDINLGKLDQTASQMLALIMGALCYQSVMKPLEKINQFEEHSLSGNPECQVFQDAIVIRSYFSKGIPLGKENLEEIKSLIGQMIPRTFIRFHTVMPDDADGLAWVMNTAKWRMQSDAYFGELVAAIASPDSTKIKRYIEDTSFMDGNDLILKRVSAFAKVSEIIPEQANHIVDQGLNGCVLAKSLANAYRSIIAVNDYIGGKIQLSALENKLKQ